MSKRIARGNTNRLNRPRRLNFEALQARTVLSATLPSFESAMLGEHARPALDSASTLGISTRDMSTGMQQPPDAQRSMIERIDGWIDQHAPPPTNERAGFVVINMHPAPSPLDFRRDGAQMAPIWNSPAPPLYLQQRLFMRIEINRSAAMAAPTPTINEFVGPQLSQPRIVSARSNAPSFGAPVVKPATVQASNSFAFASATSLDASEAPSTSRFIILPSAAIVTQTDSSTREGDDSWSTQAAFDSEGSYDVQPPASAEQSQIAAAKSANSAAGDEEKQPTYDDFIEIEGDSGLGQLPSASASKMRAGQPKHSLKPAESNVVDEIWSEFIGEDDLASLEGQGIAVPGRPLTADAALSGRQLGSDEGGLIELAVSSDAVAARGATGGPRIDETEVKMDAGVGLFQAFEMGTAPGRLEGVTADDTGRPTGPPAKSAVKKTDDRPLRSAAMAPGLGFAAMVLSGLEGTPQERRAVRLARPRRDRPRSKGA